MIELAEEIKGRAEVKGFRFIQVKKNDAAYIYRAILDNREHYEVFERRINRQFDMESYPRSASFGLWAWTYPTLDQAERKMEEITQNVLNRLKMAKERILPQNHQSGT